MHLPELRPLIGKSVEIMVREEVPEAASPKPATPYDAFFALAGQDTVDPNAYKELRARAR